MSRQFLLFLLIGGVQYALDASTFALCIVFVSAEVANVFARFIGAMSGYFLNGLFTFKKLDSKQKIAPKILLKFVLLWCVMTLLSTFMIQYSIGFFEIERWHWVVGAKLLVEAVLVVLSFSLQKFVVYR
ncbi:GtrA family protein [Marinomonas algicola]|uniref:GtrA family protein n=1 Tax=Marinomonas algicola TaxID=2773454 RepID=UPI00174D1A0D|nr:GtrA family protein [Marinomonas algicola]